MHAGQHPNDEREYSKRKSASFISDQGQCLGGRSSGKELAKCIVFEQFFFRNILAPIDESFHHHPKMSLGTAKCSNAMQEHCFQKRYVAENIQSLALISEFTHSHQFANSGI